MNFQVEQEAFQGPFDLILELLKKKELDISKLSLAKIAEDYLAFIESSEVETGVLADYLLIASKLIYMKTKELMPYLSIDEEEEGIDDLARQLAEYQKFKDIQENFLLIFTEGPVAYGAPVRKIKKEEALPMPENVTAGEMVRSFEGLLKRIAPFFKLSKTSVQRIKSVAERIEEIREMIVSRAKFTFHEAIKSARSRGEVVVSFLAVLELVRDNSLKVSQNDKSIVIERI